MNSTGKNFRKGSKGNPGKQEEIWINPVGGYGDMLMVLGVLKLAFEKKTSQKYKLARRTRYLTIFKEHPAIEYIGFPPKDAKIIRTDYWAKEKLGGGNQRPYQILARAFGLSTPVKETLYLPGKIEVDESLDKIIPWKKKNIIIAPGSDSPRKMMPSTKWESLTEKLIKENFLVIQVGRMFDRHIKGAYSLLGLTTPHQLLGVLKKVDLVITVDNFIMHAAYLSGTKTITIFGPTQPEIYGYSCQIVLRASLDHCKQCDKCLGSEYPTNYPSLCPLNHNHCMEKIPEKNIYNEVLSNI